MINQNFKDTPLAAPTLLVLAAGMGSRYGGLKQLDAVGSNGETIMDYSIYDALAAGFGKVVFVIRHDFEDEFRQRILSKYQNHIEVAVAFQDPNDLPHGFRCPSERIKPWGTNHAILAARNIIDEPFAVINADDYYGPESYRVIADYLRHVSLNGLIGQYCMVGFKVGLTMTENGAVSRGVCTADESGMLTKIIERGGIRFDNEHRPCFNDFEGNLCYLDPATPVSMNLWGFTPEYFDYSMGEFTRFLNKYVNAGNKEFFIPSVVDKLINSGLATVKILNTPARWFGVTYPQDKPTVVSMLARLHQLGVYPPSLFGN